jgi:signal peptidase
MEPTKPEFINFMGPSMKPTLKPGDGLKVIPYNGRKIRRGDVIVFLSPKDNHKITHRVLSIDSQGIRTRGDNNNKIDPETISPDKVLGRVVYAERGNRRRRVFGGPVGHFFAVTIRALHQVDSGISSLLHPSYHWLSRAGVFGRWLHTRMKTRVVSFNRSQGRELQLVMGQFVIGRLLPGRTRWHIRRPFRLFVDESSLPEHPSK